MQPLDETVCARFLNHERDVEVAGRLGNEMHLLLLKDLQGGTELMQNRPNVATYEAHGGARRYHPSLAYGVEIFEEAAEGSGAETVGVGVQRNRDGGLRCRD